MKNFLQKLRNLFENYWKFFWKLRDLYLHQNSKLYFRFHLPHFLSKACIHHTEDLLLSRSALGRMVYTPYSRQGKRHTRAGDRYLVEHPQDYERVYGPRWRVLPRKSGDNLCVSPPYELGDIVIRRYRHGSRSATRERSCETRPFMIRAKPRTGCSTGLMLSM